jgi:hypothetical protein
MATRPMIPPADPETAADAAAPGEDQDGGTEIVLKVAEDGSLSVYQEVGEDESAEQSATPAANIGEALKEILRLYKGLSAGDGQDQLQAGFAG